MIPRIGIVATPDQVALLVPILKSLGFPVTAIWCKSFAVATKLSGSTGSSCAPDSSKTSYCTVAWTWCTLPQSPAFRQR